MTRAQRTPLLVVGLTAVAIAAAAPAFAQSTSPAAVPAAAPLPSDEPVPYDPGKVVTKADTERAHQVFLSGRQFLEEANYDKAISYFKDAYSIDCDVHAILPIIATAYERKGDKNEAVRVLDEYLRRAQNPPDRDVVERRIRNLKEQIAAGAVPPPSASAASTAPPPASSVEATHPAQPPPVEPPPPHAHRSVAPWVVVGIGAAAVVGGVVTWAVGSSDVSSAESACNDTRAMCQPDVASRGNTGRSLKTVGLVVGGVGLAAIVAGVVWRVTDHSGEASAARAPIPVPVVGPGYAGLGLAGAF